MRKYSIILFTVCLSALGFVFTIKKLASPKYQISKSEISFSLKVKHSTHLFDPAFFTQAHDRSTSYKKVVNEYVYGGIIPHHLLAAPLLAAFFEGIAGQKVNTVILLTPNHYGLGPYNIATSKGLWTTIFGNAETDILKVSDLEQGKVAFVYEDLFDNEHGIYGIIPFIKKTYKNVKIVPIVIKGGTKKEELDNLVNSLNKIYDKNTLLVVSADFSHYVSSKETKIYDNQSIDAINSFNTAEVLKLDHSKNLDSPEAIYVLLKIMEKKNAKKAVLLANYNSAEITNQTFLKNVTSYTTFYFTKP